jgi:chorismate synthase
VDESGGNIMDNSIGKIFRMTSFGESHGRCVGVVLDGCPAGLRLDPEEIQGELDRRRPSQSGLTTSRGEEDRLEVLSGIHGSHTTGAPICMLVWNRDKDSSGYEERRWTPRPGHADWTAHVRYGGFNDYRGGGRFSGRITAGYVMAGAVAKTLLRKMLGVKVLAHTIEIGSVRAGEVSIEDIESNVEGNPVRCADPVAADRMRDAINRAAEEGDSLGGAVECIALNMPPGVGGPVFNTLEGDIAKALFAIPAVKAVEVGLGTAYSGARGSDVNDEYTLKEGGISLKTNNAGGVLGGIRGGPWGHQQRDADRLQGDLQAHTFYQEVPDDRGHLEDGGDGADRRGEARPLHRAPGGPGGRGDGCVRPCGPRDQGRKDSNHAGDG